MDSKSVALAYVCVLNWSQFHREQPIRAMVRYANRFDMDLDGIYLDIDSNLSRNPSDGTSGSEELVRHLNRERLRVTDVLVINLTGRTEPPRGKTADCIDAILQGGITGSCG